MTYAAPPTPTNQQNPNANNMTPGNSSSTQQIYAQNHSNNNGDNNGNYSQSAASPQQQQQPQEEPDMANAYDREIDAMQAIIDSLNTLDTDAQSRVLTYLNDRYLGMASVPATPNATASVTSISK